MFDTIEVVEIARLSKKYQPYKKHILKLSRSKFIFHFAFLSLFFWIWWNFWTKLRPLQLTRRMEVIIAYLLILANKTFFLSSVIISQAVIKYVAWKINAYVIINFFHCLLNNISFFLFYWLLFWDIIKQDIIKHDIIKYDIILHVF